jgi:hypothetical protein
MKIPMATTTGHHDHPPQTRAPAPLQVETAEAPEATEDTETTEATMVEVRQTRRVRPIGPLDRLALHLGVALIRWGRRPAKTTRRERTRRERPVLSREAYEAQRQAEALRDEYRTMSMTQYR